MSRRRQRGSNSADTLSSTNTDSNFTALTSQTTKIQNNTINNHFFFLSLADSNLVLVFPRGVDKLISQQSIFTIVMASLQDGLIIPFLLLITTA